jgi:threonine aldolase
MARYDFASDNTAPVAPEAMEALLAANTGFAPAYGQDPLSIRGGEAVRALLDADAEVRFVASGTAANSIALAALCRPFEAVLAHSDAHVRTDETGAPGFFGQGLGFYGLRGSSGRISTAALEEALAQPDFSHRQPAAALSITNVTEYGTLYSVESVAALTRLAKARNCKVHLDGARIANAAAAGFDLTAIKDLDIDILILGGAKAGMPPTEAIVIFDKGLVRRFDARLKQAGQLPSKGRFYAAPFIGMLEGGAFVRRAAHANAMATRLAELSPFPLRHPVEANSVFVDMDRPTLARLHKAGWIVYPFHDGSVRFVCSWATTAEAVEEFGNALSRIR